MKEVFSNELILRVIEILLFMFLGFILYQVVNYKSIRDHKLQRKQAYTDQLTGRGNRYLFLAVLDKLIKKGKKFAVCFMDLDGFKQINDTMGHDAGDELLVYLARTFDEKLPQNAVAYRLGGDEFAIVIQNIKTTHDVTKILDYMKKQFEVPIQIHDTNISLQYSLGVAIYPEDADNKTDLIMYADDAMYYIKENGKNGYYFPVYLPFENMTLKEAYEKEEFAVSLQPRINLDNVDNICFETLLYWNHPVLGKLESSYFIKQADEMGIIVKLDRFVLETICKKLNKLKQAGYSNIQMCVNISNRHFMKEDFVDELCKILKQYDVKKNEICFEVTNDIPISKIKMYKDMFEKLKNAGVVISINNFNIKYDDMVLYKELNIDEIKLYAKYISRESDLDKDSLKDIVELSKGLGAKVVICCIETKEQLDVAVKYGANKIQGNLLFNKMYDEYIKDTINKYDKLKATVHSMIETSKNVKKI